MKWFQCSEMLGFVDRGHFLHTKEDTVKKIFMLLIACLVMLSFNTHHAAASVSGEYDLVQLIVDFPPGTWTPSHTHGGQVLVTVLEGETTVRDILGVEKIYKAGESFVETPGTFLEVGNPGSTLTRNAALVLLPKGAQLTTTRSGLTTQNAPPGPTTVYRNQTSVDNLDGEYDLVQLIVDFAPGAWTPSHTHGGPVLVTVLDGETTTRDGQGVENKYQVGQNFVETPGTFLEVGNSGSGNTRNAAGVLLPKGAQVTTTQSGVSTQNAPPGPTTVYRTQAPVASSPVVIPTTGMAALSSYWAWLGLAGLGLLALGWMLRRSKRSS